MHVGLQPRGPSTRQPALSSHLAGTEPTAPRSLCQRLLLELHAVSVDESPASLQGEAAPGLAKAGVKPQTSSARLCLDLPRRDLNHPPFESPLLRRPAVYAPSRLDYIVDDLFPGDITEENNQRLSLGDVDT